MSQKRAIGTCHCGSVEIEIPFDGEFKKLCRCDCSYCSRRWAVTTSVQTDQLKILKGAEKLSLYQWGTGIAKHYFCSVCGIYTHHQRRSDPTEYSINIACFDGVKVRDYGAVDYMDGVNHPCDR